MTTGSFIPASGNRAPKIEYIDRLRVLMTVLVIFHHAAVTYGAPGGWYLKEPSTSQGAVVALTWFVATNQSFFMGFFFFLSALFTPAAYDKKGPVRFLTDRLKRLGIPLLFYSFVISPLTIWLVEKYQRNVSYSFSDFLKGFDGWINFGVLWFVAALLIFTLVYMLAREWTTVPAKRISVPSSGRIVVFALGIGLLTFLVRIFFPVGWVLKPLGFQPGHFTQYIALYFLGLMAGRNHWLVDFPVSGNRFWIMLSAVLILAGFPALYVFKQISGAGFAEFTGGAGLPSLLNSVWEQLTGFSVIMALTGWFKKKDKVPGRVMLGMARGAYAVYIIHPLILVAVTVFALRLPYTPEIKFLPVALVAAFLSFATAALLLRLPGVNRVV